MTASTSAAEEAETDPGTGTDAPGDGPADDATPPDAEPNAETDAEAAADTAETASVDDEDEDRTVRRTERWEGIAAVALLAGGLGVLVSQQGLLLSGVVGVAYAAYARASDEQSLALDVTRELGDATPEPGDEVTVTVTVENEGEEMVPDLRLVDGVPEPLTVASGSPRHGTALRPGESATFRYAVVATRGEHAFRPMQVIARGFAGTVEVETTASVDTTLLCSPELSRTDDVPLRSLTSRYTGRVDTDTGGAGVEFFATRDYRPGDSLSRIDWNRHARTGELATLEFREERSATVALVVDVREEAYLRADETARHAVDRSVDAASQAFAALLNTGDRVGLASFGPEDCWLAPGVGSEHRARARELFSSHPALSPSVPDQRFLFGIYFRKLRRRLPGDAQVILFSPLCDDVVVRLARLLDAHGHLVTVVSPDPTGEATAGQRLARAERIARMTGLREAGIRVVDFEPDTHLAGALARAKKRWSR